MSDDRIYNDTFDTQVTGFGTVFGVRRGQHLTIETNVLATGSPTGTWALQRFDETGTWAAANLGSQTFSDPAAGAANGTINVLNPIPGKYRMAYTAGSGGAANGGTSTVRSASYG